MPKVNVRHVDFYEIVKSIENRPPDGTVFVCKNYSKDPVKSVNVFVYGSRYVEILKKRFNPIYEDNDGTACFKIDNLSPVEAKFFLKLTLKLDVFLEIFKN